ncbi:MAG: acyloxyacyl hydrolase [Betaproteobacteria bacterium]|nr:MAG: acyloxyacyl hydrolase [Betaproteobacteria bacterium]
MSFSRGTVAAILLAGASSALAAEPELGVSVARSFDAHETDILRLTYRRSLEPHGGAQWWPQQLQLGASVWRVPDLGGVTRRFDVNVTPVWRSETDFGGAAKGYVEAGLGVYLLSHSIHNDTNRLPTSLEFGSHLGAGVLLDPRLSVGLAVQHISNAGIKQPNGGINLYMLTTSYRF